MRRYATVKVVPFQSLGRYMADSRITLYGLRRSPRSLSTETFSSVLSDLGLTKCPHDPCLFVGKSPTGGTIYFGTYVDDCGYFGTDDATEEWFETALGSRLKIDFMGRSFLLSRRALRMVVHVRQPTHSSHVSRRTHSQDA